MCCSLSRIYRAISCWFASLWISRDLHRMWFTFDRSFRISSVGREVTIKRNVPGSFGTRWWRIESVTRSHPSSNPSITMTAGPSIWCRETGFKMSSSNWRDWLAEATLRSFARTWVTCPTRQLFSPARSRAMVLKSLRGFLLSGVLRSKKNDEASIPSWKHFWAMVCAIALLPAPATSHNQNISAVLVSSAAYIHFHISSKISLRVSGKHTRSGFQEAPSAYGKISSGVFVTEETNE